MKFTRTFAVKLIAAVLCAASVLVFVASALVVGFSFSEHLYDLEDGTTQQFYHSLLSEDASDILYFYADRTEPALSEAPPAEDAAKPALDATIRYLEQNFSATHTNLRYYLYTYSETDGTCLLHTNTNDSAFDLTTSLAENQDRYGKSVPFYIFQLFSTVQTEWDDRTETEYTYPTYEVYNSEPNEVLSFNGSHLILVCYADTDTGLQDIYWLIGRLYHMIFQYRYIALYTMIASGLLFLFLLIYLCFVAGRPASKTETQVQLRASSRLPLELPLTAVVLLWCLFYALLNEFLWYNNWQPIDEHLNGFQLELLLLSLLLYGCTLLSIGVLMDFAARFKAGKWWRRSFCYYCLYPVRWLFRKCLHLLKRFGSGIAQLSGAIPRIWKFIVLYIGYSFVLLCGGIITASNGSGGGFFVFFLLLSLFTGLPLLFLVLQTTQLTDCAREIAAGNTDSRVDTSKMFSVCRTHGDYLNHISEGISVAVEERLKSERFRTELITNVSHDLKTPLTSIINYVDLLQKEPLHNETAIEYLSVLEHQSKRLKKLTDDLVEASKASTGNVPVNMKETDLIVLLSQTAGEYEDRLAQKQLSLVIVLPKNEPTLKIMADGRLLWRVFDNLMSNICKYSLPQTRVYLNAEATETHCTVIFRNVSAAQLNISPDELMERFVRGDVSRSTEGSGLGLNIARSLTELQNGRLLLQVDGDLFKVILSFPRLHSSPQPPVRIPLAGEGGSTQTAPEQAPAAPVAPAQTTLQAPAAAPTQTTLQAPAAAQPQPRKCTFLPQHNPKHRSKLRAAHRHVPTAAAETEISDQSSEAN